MSSDEEIRKTQIYGGIRVCGNTIIVMSCNNCGMGADKKCGGCKQVTYCSRKCQKEDWKNHKHKCIKKIFDN